jgi:hypothetical protein
MKLSDFYTLDPSKRVRAAKVSAFPDGLAPLVGGEFDVTNSTADYDQAINAYGHLHMVEGWKIGTSADAGDTVDLIRVRDGVTDTIATLVCSVADGAVIVPGSWDDSHANFEPGDILRASATSSTDVACTLHFSLRLA